MTKLLDAILENDYVKVKKIIKRGANVNSGKKTTPLHEACKYSRVKIVQLLLKSNADVDSVNNNLETPLFVAVEQNDLQIVKILLFANANVNLSDVNKYSPLHNNCSEDIMKELLKANADVNAKTKTKHSPLELTRDIKSKNILKKYIKIKKTQITRYFSKTLNEDVSEIISKFLYQL